MLISENFEKCHIANVKKHEPKTWAERYLIKCQDVVEIHQS